MLGVGFAAACGGKSRHHDGPATAGAPSAGLGSGGASGGGTAANGGAGTTGSVGSGGSGAAASCDGVPYPSYFSCAPGCETPVDYHRQAICVDGAWGCNPGEIGVWECAPDSCTQASDHECCDPDDGHRTPVECSPEGPVLPCPDGTVNLEPRRMCAAKSAAVETCIELDAEPCSRVGDRCGYVRTCSVHCECEDGADGLRWDCVSPLC